MSAMPETIPYQYQSFADRQVSPSRGQRRRYQSSVSPECYVRMMGIILFLAMLMILRIGGRIQLTVQGYQLHRLQQQLASTEQSNRQLEVESAIMIAPSRVIPEAPQLSMVQASPFKTAHIPVTTDAPGSGSGASGSTALAMVP